jgi:hypothetical protein
MERSHFSSILEAKHYIQSECPNEDGEEPRYLFRGENSCYENVKSSFGRFAERWPDSVGHVQRIYLSIKSRLRGLDGYAIETDQQAMALLQHYWMPTPQIDLSGNIDVAIYFAIDGKESHNTSRITIVDRNAVPDDLEIINHNFLVTKDLNEAEKNRYLRQDGYAIAPKDYRNATIVKNFDLMNPAYRSFVKCITFDPSDPANIALTKDKVYDGYDFIPGKMKMILQGMAEEFELVDNKFRPELLEVIDKIYPR